jgi:DNA-binding transcriptional LysR family regulator
VMQTLQGAQHGLGVALTYRPLIGPAPFGVPLVSPFALEVPVGRALWLVCREADRSLPKIVALRRWLLKEIATLE